MEEEINRIKDNLTNPFVFSKEGVCAKDKIPTIEDCRKCKHCIEWEYTFDVEQQPFSYISCEPQGQVHGIDFKNCPLNNKTTNKGAK